jgi:hypothetical protein
VSAIFPDVPAALAKFAEQVGPLLKAAYLAGVRDGAIGAVLVLLVVYLFSKARS